MLSKLRHFSGKQGGALSDLKAGINPSLLLQHLGDDVTNVRSIDGGTLGAGFLLEVNGQRRFLKTHAVKENWQVLGKEAAILSCLYQEQIHLERIELHDAANTRLCLVMDELVYPPAEFDVRQVLGVIEDYSQRLKNWQGGLHIPDDDDFSCLLKEGRAALRHLAGEELLSSSVCASVQSCLTLLERQIDRFPRCLCHGDLGPKNLMSDGVQPIVIDWEDAFWGIEGYDYLYWLTFFNNRKYYSQQIFGKTPWGKEVEIAIIVLVILLKCELSVRTNNHKNNKLTFDQRIIEILTLA